MREAPFLPINFPGKFIHSHPNFIFSLLFSITTFILIKELYGNIQCDASCSDRCSVLVMVQEDLTVAKRSTCVACIRQSPWSDRAAWQDAWMDHREPPCVRRYLPDLYLCSAFLGKEARPRDCHVWPEESWTHAQDPVW